MLRMKCDTPLMFGCYDLSSNLNVLGSGPQFTFYLTYLYHFAPITHFGYCLAPADVYRFVTNTDLSLETFQTISSFPFISLFFISKPIFSETPTDDIYLYYFLLCLIPRIAVRVSFLVSLILVSQVTVTCCHQVGGSLP